jgi:hypothetical protein
LATAGLPPVFVDTMRILLIATIPLIAGCFIGDAAVPIVCSTDLPGTQYSIYLHGPHDIGYFYTIETPDGDCGFRELGQIEIDESVPPKLEDLGNGVFRVTWGKHPDAAFATLDTKQKLIVADSNKSNVVNVPFDTPRYLRPE